MGGSSPVFGASEMAAFEASNVFGRFWSRLGDEARVRRDFWPKLKSTVAKIPFAEDAVAAYYCALDRETPLRVRSMLLAALVYFIMPADALPDVLPALGFTDDAAVLMATLQLIASHIQPAHRDAARAALNDLEAPSK
jgi:uncharacterized membrane protein YkvA (DUF1232 family)